MTAADASSPRVVPAAAADAAPRPGVPRRAQAPLLGLLGALGLVGVIRVDSAAGPTAARVALVVWASVGTGVLVAAILAHCVARRNARARRQPPSGARAPRGTIL
ncbi:hypothetical protein [Streptomyces sp. Da 82-17]|uniref:hypothetical protein n=1 Tax=Streptomyces sp. Da 82-17 TaxID=3377116 RepID=UPI0038D35FB7